MHDHEQQTRREAVRRVMAGEPVAAVAADMGRSQPWVRKWAARYDPTDEGWADSHSRAPKTLANRTDGETEALALKVRRHLAAEPWAQVGASAIAWELTKLGIADPPPARTIERILARHDVSRRARRGRYIPRAVPYPAPPMVAPNACQQGDTVGPRHLEGDELFYVFNVVDVGRRKAAGQICASQSAKTTGRLPGTLLRLCLVHGVIPTFIPFAEPRNGGVEHFNDTFDNKSFRTERFTSVTKLVDRCAAFETFHTATHRYSALKGAGSPHRSGRAHGADRARSGTAPGATTPRRRPRAWFPAGPAPQPHTVGSRTGTGPGSSPAG